MSRTKKFLLIGLLAATASTAAVAGGLRGGHCGMRAETAEEAREHADRMADRALDRIDATDAQRASVDTLLDSAVPKAFALHEEGAALREEGRELFTAETIDRAGVETLRKDALGLFDEGSRLAADTAVALASILTPEQRLELAETMDQMHGARHGDKPRGEGPR